MKTRISLLVFVALFACAAATSCRNNDPTPNGHQALAR